MYPSTGVQEGGGQAKGVGEEEEEEEVVVEVEEGESLEIGGFCWSTRYIDLVAAIHTRKNVFWVRFGKGYLESSARRSSRRKPPSREVSLCEKCGSGTWNGVDQWRRAGSPPSKSYSVQHTQERETSITRWARQRVTARAQLSHTPLHYVRGPDGAGVGDPSLWAVERHLHNREYTTGSCST